MNTNGATRANGEGLPATTPIQILYREWATKHRHLSKGGFIEAEQSALIDEMDACADKLLALPAESPLDVVAKLLAASDKMEVQVRGEWEDSLREEALAFVAVEPELPWVKVRRLARELSETLAECDDGECHAEVHPKGRRELPIIFWNKDGSPIMGLFREWESKYARVTDPTTPEPEGSDLLDECRALERQMLSIPAISSADFAAKLLAITSYGSYSLEDDAGSVFIDEARALVGKAVAA